MIHMPIVGMKVLCHFVGISFIVLWMSYGMPVLITAVVLELSYAKWFLIAVGTLVVFLSICLINMALKLDPSKPEG